MSKSNFQKKINKHINLNYEINSRKKKLSLLRKEKKIIFPNNFRRNILTDQIYKKYNKNNNKELKDLKINVNVAGRIINIRIMGKASFIILQDINGKIQLYISCNNMSHIKYKKEIEKLDIGDIIGASGILFKTNTKELSVNCNVIILLTKSLRPLPNKFHGLIDKETRYRQRYLDLISNDKSRQIFKIRSLAIKEIRSFMIEKKFMEVETPIMQNLPGGAIARPFITHHNSLDIDIYLRVAPELYLKQLVIGGFEKVFEINKSFRNEGISTHHNPEFTMMELYLAYADYNDLIIFVEEFFRILTKRILGKSIIYYGNEIFDFCKPFIKMTMKEAICHYYPNIKPKLLDNKYDAILIAKSLNIKIEKTWGLGKIQTEIFEKTVEKHLIQPTFITNYPLEVSPLARSNDNNKFISDRFEFFIGGHEIGNGFSEINDSEDQKNRFYNQLKYKNYENDKSMFFDKDYITALEYGLPPTAGLGMGIDRIIMLLTNTSNIRDVILFPMLKPKI